MRDVIKLESGSRYATVRPLYGGHGRHLETYITS